ncbi:SRPBCC family protein [Natrialbaceae archaeon AArc-T1-2]|uniref:SRPBCC family protein n=1 Tax=Natrialbaceae archaeon AArc-T1-2 TaxID=3053904 RepID=UPI00255AE08F|nr:SRPBCC family protein [Natrialbaceae archaeon AArc-T1-2]WIV65822.1 SRPBCC family protein [Natrialbaceae archaeon AArc-T1-2]
MDRILVSTVVYRPPETVFPYLESFTDYPRYADHLEAVSRRDDGRQVRADGDVVDPTDELVGARYDLQLSWWKLSYTARSEIVDVDEPTSLEWRLVKDLDARGEWRVEPEPESAPEHAKTASRVYFDASYDPHSANEEAVSLPRFVSMGWVIDKIRPRLLSEAERVVNRLVADVEGEPRSVEFDVHEMP